MQPSSVGYGSMTMVQVIVFDPATSSEVFVPSPFAPVVKSKVLSEQSTVDAVPPSALESTEIVTLVSGEFVKPTASPTYGLSEHLALLSTVTLFVVAPSAL